MATFADGKIEAYLGPVEFGAADNLEQVIVSFINGARHRLDIAVQELDSEPIAQAILDARWRGVAVDMFLEQDYLRTRLKATPDPPTPAPGETPDQALLRTQWQEEEGARGLAENRRILRALLRSDIEVRGDYNPAIFHQKFILRDYPGKAFPTSALLTGSANFTLTDTHANLNHLFIFRNAHVCRQYLTEVEQLRLGRFGRGLHGDIPATYNLAGIPIKILFAPDHTPELELIKQILQARTSIRFAIFTFAGSSGIDDALLAMARGGIQIHGVLDPGQAKQGWAAPKWLQHPNISLRIPDRKTGALKGLGKLHHKLLVVDDRIVAGGSFNYTQPANDYNDENLFVLGSAHTEVEGIPVAPNPCQQLTTHIRTEIERLYKISAPFTP